MPFYSYKASDVNGRMVAGSLEAKDKASVVERLRESRLYPVKIEEKGSLATREINVSFALGGISNKDVMFFTQQLSSLLDAGLSLDKSLTVLVDLCENKKMTEMICDIQKAIQGGSSFADSLAKYPKQFSRLYVNMVRAGESGGVLELVMERLAVFLEETQALKEEVASAMIYPILLSLVAASAVIILMTFVIPKFSELFKDMGKTLPASTEMLMVISNVMSEYWWVFLLGVALLCGLFKYFVSKDEGRIVWDGLMLRFPLLGSLVQKIEVSRFSRTLGTLITSGVPILTALKIVKEVIGNQLMAKAMENIHSGLKEGEGISDPLEKTALFPPLAIHMIRIGEETGHLDQMLLKVAKRFDQDVKATVKRLISLLEPAMILIMAGIVAFIVISMLMAIFSINEMSF